MAKSSKPTWSQLKSRLKQWDSKQLIGLIQDLFSHSSGNRDFLSTRLLGEANDPATLGPYLERIQIAFYGRRGLAPGPMNLRDGRQALQDYRAASGDLAGTLELMLTYVETGTKLTCEFGDIDEGFYDSLCSVLDELDKHLRSSEGRPLYPRLWQRLVDLAEQADGIGWGYGDYVGDVVEELADAHGRAAD
jgi:hypothetical protein